MREARTKDPFHQFALENLAYSALRPGPAEGRADDHGEDIMVQGCAHPGAGSPGNGTSSGCHDVGGVPGEVGQADNQEVAAGGYARRAGAARSTASQGAHSRGAHSRGTPCRERENIPGEMRNATKDRD